VNTVHSRRRAAADAISDVVRGGGGGLDDILDLALLLEPALDVERAPGQEAGRRDDGTQPLEGVVPELA
jgi:hypothetical protein